MQSLLGRLAILAASLAAAAQASPVFLAGAHDYSILRLVHDRRGYAYVAGRQFVRAPSGSSAAGNTIVARISPAGNVEWIKSFGEGVTIQALALDIHGDLLIGGSAASLDFVDSRAIQAEPASRGPTAFLGKLNVDSGRWIYSTYFGGKAGPSEIMAISAGKDGAIYITGFTTASDYPTTGNLRFGAPPIFNVPRANHPAFVAKLSPAADRILISGYFGGRAVACGCCSVCFLSTRRATGTAIGVDGAGNIVVAGNTNTTDLPTTEGAMLRSGIGAFVAAVKADGSGLAYLTYLGEANYVQAPYNTPGTGIASLAIDAAGDVIIGASTFDPNLPATPGVIQMAYSDSRTSRQRDVFLAKLKRDGSGFHWGTYFGGREADSLQSMALDAAGRVWITGTTESPDFPRTEGWSLSGGDFVALISQDGSKLHYSTRFPTGTAAAAISVDASGLAWTAGRYGYISSHVPGARPRPAVYTAGTGIGDRSVAPGMVIDIRGGWIGPATPETVASGALHIPTALAGWRVLFDGMPAPLLRVSPHEIVAVAPFGLAGRESANLVVEAGGEPLPPFPVRVEPELLRILRKPNGVALVNEDGSDNTPTQPARLGSVVSLWLNGAGVAAGVDGEIVLEPRPYECCSVSFFILGRAEVLYSGAAPGIVAGVTQINFRAPATLGDLVFEPPSRGIPIYVKGRSPHEPSATLFVAP